MYILQTSEEESPQQTQEGGEEEVKEKAATELTEKEPESKADEEQPAVLPSEEAQEEEVKGEAAAPPPRRLKVRTTDPSDGVDLAMGVKGIEALPPITVGMMFQDAVEKFSSHPALQYKEEGEWKTITYGEYYELCIRASKSFLKVSTH